MFSHTFESFLNVSFRCSLGAIDGPVMQLQEGDERGEQSPAGHAMVGQGVGDADRWTLVDETLEETLSFQELQFVRERPARDPSKEMLELIESRAPTMYKALRISMVQRLPKTPNASTAP